MKNNIVYLDVNNLSPARNIEGAYEEILLCVFGGNINRKSEKWEEVKNKMQLFLLSYALWKNADWDNFECLKLGLKEKLDTLKQENSWKNEEELFLEIITPLLEKTYAELKENNSLYILEEIIWTEETNSLHPDKEERECEQLEESVIFSTIEKFRWNIKEVIESDEFKNARNKKDFLKKKGISYKRGIELYYQRVKEKCFSEEEKNNPDELAQKMQKFNIAYILCKYKFQDNKRSSGERYFDHLLSVVDLYLTHEKNPTFSGMMIAMLHDSVEDTDLSWKSLEYLFEEEIATGVCNLSKPSVREYVEEWSKDEDFFEKWIELGFLNAKWLLSDKIKRKEHRWKLTNSEKRLWIQYKNIHAVYKKQRNKDYFKKFISKGNENFLDERTETEIKVKCYDRIHNTQTLMWFGISKIDKIFQKIDETIEYFLPVTQKHFPEIHELLTSELLKVLEKINQGMQNIAKQDRKYYRSRIQDYKNNIRNFQTVSEQVNNTLNS